jgi:hypothetical protein
VSVVAERQPLDAGRASEDVWLLLRLCEGEICFGFAEARWEEGQQREFVIEECETVRVCERVMREYVIVPRFF